MNDTKFRPETFVISHDASRNVPDSIPHESDYVGLRSREIHESLYLVFPDTVFSDSARAKLDLASAGYCPVGYFQAKAFNKTFPEACRAQPIVVLNACWNFKQGHEQRVLVLPMLGASGVPSEEDTLVLDEGKWEKHAAFLVSRIGVFDPQD